MEKDLTDDEFEELMNKRYPHGHLTISFEGMNEQQLEQLFDRVVAMIDTFATSNHLASKRRPSELKEQA